MKAPGDAHGSDEVRLRQERLDKLVERMIANNVAPGSPSLAIVQHLGDRWSPLILLALNTGTYRHTELQRAINALSEISKSTHVSQHVLTMKLRALERDGLISRKLWATVPPRTDYALTPMGRELAHWLMNLCDWSERHAGEITAARAQFDEARNEG